MSCTRHRAHDTLNLTFPADYPDEQALTDYITQNRDGSVKVAQSSGPRDQPYQLEATTEQHSSGQPPHNTRSVVLKFFQDLGGAHPSIWYKAFNYNLGTKQPITFDNLFAPGTTPLDSIFPIVQRDLERQSPLGAAILPSTGLDPSHYQNFAITDDQLIFYFAPGEMLPAFAGPVRAQAPRNTIPPLGDLTPSLGRREAVNLTVAGGGHHSAIVADRHPDGIPGGRRKWIAVERVAIVRIEDQHRHTGHAVCGWPADNRVADAGTGQARCRQRDDVIAAPNLIGVIT